jgi:carbon-monoxide dehydrogenase large subunit
MMATTVPKQIGSRIRRKEDPRLITGSSTYTDDLKLPGMLSMVLVRSPHAHARITEIDVSEAEGMEGVVAVVTGADLEGAVAGLPVAHTLEQLKEPPHRALSIDKVRYVGDAVAAVVAVDSARARDAAERVHVGYESLDAVLDLEAAIEEGSALVHDEEGSNVAYEFPFLAGDVDAAFAEAESVIRLRLMNQRQIPVALEPRCVIARFDRGFGKLTLWSTTQIPHLLRTQLAVGLGLPEHSVRVIAPEVGGGFGSKLNVYAEEFLAAHLSRTLGRPVKWTADRSEGFLATTHGRDQLNDVEVGVDDQGRLLGMRPCSCSPAAIDFRASRST